MIETSHQKFCPACSAVGIAKYSNLKDILSNTEGVWKMDVCSNNKCQTNWLNPAPRSSELIKLYDNYTTHTRPAISEFVPPKKLLKKISHLANQAVLSELNYKNNSPWFINKFFRLISWLHPGWRNSQLDQVMYVPFVENGHLLDVGCGSGGAMLSLKRRGWEVTGTDFDTTALAAARSNGLRVFAGELSTINFPSKSFDAILLSHVIEHVPNPVDLLSECKRILKNGGRLIVITPNSNSSSHEKFKTCWRGLEVPRHLQIFTPYSLGLVAAKAGFTKIKSSTCLQGFLYLKDASKACLEKGTYDLPQKNFYMRLNDALRVYIAGIFFTFSAGKEETNLLYCEND